jgi:hypothetical protein
MTVAPTLDDALFDRLTTGPMTALIADRVYPVVAPQNVAYPCITWQRISRTDVRSLQGPSGYADVRVQVDCWALTYTAVRQLAKAARQRLDGWDNDGQPVADCAIDSERDLYDPTAEPRLHRTTLDFIITETE